MIERAYTIRNESDFIDRLGLNEYSKEPRLITLKKYRNALIKRVNWKGLNRNKVLGYVNFCIRKELGEIK